jgi:omega-hydroxypalmitate O-feruloyl transferase
LDRTVLNPRSPPRIEFPHLEMSCDVDEEAAISSPLDAEKEEEYHPNNSSSSSPKNSFFGSFSLSPEEVESLKRQTLNEGLFTKVTAFEVLAALTWRARTQALDMPPTQVARLLFAVNVRDKLDPPLPKRFMGNGILFAHASATAAELATSSLAQTVKLVQDARAMITDRYVRSAIDFFEVTRAQMIARATLFVSSWVGIPIHLVDFGWGQPMCALPGTMLPEDAILAPSTCFSNLEAADSSLKLCIALHSQEAVDGFGHCLSSKMPESTRTHLA